MISLLRFPRAPFVLVSTSSLLLVIGGVLMSQLMHLAACPLCVIQRMFYLALSIVAVIGLIMAASGLGRRLGALAMAAMASGGAFVAGYQSWIQRFAQDTGCSGRPTWWEDMVSRAGDAVPLLFQSDGICSDPGWVFLGLSIAEWSLIFFIAYFLISLYTLLRR